VRRALRDLPIRRKLTLIILATCALALSLSAIVVAVFDVLDVRRRMVHDTTVLADVIARNTQASLAFRDSDEAANTLRALQSAPNVAMACVYDAGGKRFAEYVRGDRAPQFAASPDADGHRFTRGALALFRPVMLNGKRIGTIYLASPLRPIYERVGYIAALRIMVLAGALLVAFALSRRMQKVIAEPLLALTATSRVIAAHGDFTVRAVRMGNDEIGELTGVFNQMLDTLAELNEKLESRVLERTAQLQRANEELESFSYSVSHDLRAPLRAVDGYARLLAEDHAASLDDDGQRLLSVVRDEARRMGGLIDDLLDFSRVSRQALRPSPIDLASMAEGIVAELRRTQPERTIELTCAPLPRALADGATIRQVLVNLLSNAVKYAKSEGAIRIEIDGSRDGAMSSYRIRDRGVGFDMRYVDKIFGVFQRLHGDEFEGTGVGLAIVERIVVRHGGRVRAEGVPGQGASFHFTLPAAGREET
jgi:signal transduction histidine kinase